LGYFLLLTTFFLGYVLILTKNGMGNILGDFFLKLVWAPCSEIQRPVFKAKLAPTWGVGAYVASTRLHNSDTYSLVGA
jgi:hypothetical protein